MFTVIKMFMSRSINADLSAMMSYDNTCVGICKVLYKKYRGVF